MANLILTAAGWEGRVRDRLGIDAAYLPDAALQQPEIIAVAEANIIEQVPDYASLTGSKRTWLEAAVVCECAILACGSMASRLPAREQGPHFAQETTVDWDELRAKLEAERDGYICRLIDVQEPPHFGLTQ